MNIQQLIEFFDSNGFCAHEQDVHNGILELETWTRGGVNMLMYLEPITIQSFEEQVNSFDVDEEIEVHRQDDRYRRDFTIRESLEDFEEYHLRLKQVLINLKEAAKRLENKAT